MCRISIIVLFFLLLTTPANAQVEGYYRQPDIHGNLIVFNAEGDLWTASATGGTARRITTHLGK